MIETCLVFVFTLAALLVSYYLGRIKGRVDALVETRDAINKKLREHGWEVVLVEKSND